MATVSEAIDELVDFTDNVGVGQIDQPENRRRHLKTLIRVVKKVRYHRDWAYARSYGTVAIPALQGYGLLPLDFLQIGKYGLVANLSDVGRPLSWVPESVITEARVRGDCPSWLGVYSLFGMLSPPPVPPSTAALPPQHLIQIPPNASAVSLAVAYVTKVPALDETSTNNGNLVLAIPEEYHDTVVIPGMKAESREGKADARWQNALGEYQQGLRDMRRTCRRSQGTISQLPGFFG